jgi:hypothetical protein
MLSQKTHHRNRAGGVALSSKPHTAKERKKQQKNPLHYPGRLKPSILATWVSKIGRIKVWPGQILCKTPISKIDQN